MASLSSATNDGADLERSSLDDRSVPPLGMSGAQFRDAASLAINEIERYYSNISARPVLPSISPGYLRDQLPAAPPTHGETWANIEEDIERNILPGMTHWQSPKFMAFFSASSTYPGILGEMWSAALTAPAFNWICSPAVTELETIVMDWLVQILGLPTSFLSKGEGGGVIQGSASEAIVTVMVSARERYIRRQLERECVTDPDAIEDRSCELRAELVALGSEQAHSSTKKAAIIAGTRYRSIPTWHSDDFALKGHELRQKIEGLTAKGLRPYYLTVTLGSTNTCAIDDFVSIAEVMKDFPDIWVHCDAAWAGAGLVLPEYQYLSTQVGFADSFNMNMHKWLLTNFDASCLFVRKRRDLTDALSITPAYLKNDFSESGLVTDYRDWQIPLGRRFRSLKIWFVIRTWGVKGMREHIKYHINLGDLFAGLIRSRPDLFSILTPPAFALTVFTVNAPEHSPRQPHVLTSGSDPRPDQDRDLPVEPDAPTAELDATNAMTTEVFTLFDRRKEFFLTSTVVGGAFAIRVVSANPLAEEKYVRKVFADLVALAEEVRARAASSRSRL